MKEAIYKKLKAKIINGEISPGSLLVEREISDNYGISRTPIREILWHLESDGLITRDASKGYVIRNVSLEEIISIFQSREGIEGIATRVACLKGNEGFLNQLDELGKIIEAISIDKDAKKHILYGKRLHDLIVSTANNIFLIEFYNKLTALSVLIRNITKKSVSIEKKSQELHLKIIDELKKKNAEKSEYYMREHLKYTCSMIAKEFYPDFFSNKSF